MKKGIFIQANNKQLLGAKIAKFAMETRGKAQERGIPVTIMNVEENPTYMSYAGMTYKRGTETRTHDPNDLQFFTLSRFMPPELMNHEGRALVIDPDIFALADIGELFEMNLQGNAVAACPKKEHWDTSVMVLDCARLPHWNIKNILEGLKNGTEDYRAWMQLKKEKVTPLSRDWNSLDTLTPHTKMLHTTNRLTQPWKTGLPIDFTLGVVPKLFGIIPRFLVSRPTHYQKHPDKNIEHLFLTLTKEAMAAGVFSSEELDREIASHNIRSDLYTALQNT